MNRETTNFFVLLFALFLRSCYFYVCCTKQSLWLHFKATIKLLRDTEQKVHPLFATTFLSDSEQFKIFRKIKVTFRTKVGMFGNKLINKEIKSKAINEDKTLQPTSFEDLNFCHC